MAPFGGPDRGPCICGERAGREEGEKEFPGAARALSTWQCQLYATDQYRIRFSEVSCLICIRSAWSAPTTQRNTAFTRTVGRPPVRFARDSGGVRSAGY